MKNQLLKTNSSLQIYMTRSDELSIFLMHGQVLKIWLLTQNFSFMVAGGAVVAILVHPNLTSSNIVAFIILVILINISAAIAVLSTLAGTILVEREW